MITVMLSGYSLEIPLVWSDFREKKSKLSILLWWKDLYILILQIEWALYVESEKIPVKIMPYVWISIQLKI